jgi:molybdopterin/thiamine biosynthesis adenylyltransferase
MYEQIFERNYGVFSQEEQARIRNSKIVIVGSGGIGGMVAVVLARSGIENFILYDYDEYSITNLNRQIGCFQDTIGRNKAEVIKEQILAINPNANVVTHQKAASIEEMDQIIQEGDVFLPAADQWPLSIAMLNRSKELGKPAIMAYPVGSLARVCVFLPDSPYAAECLVQPYKANYEQLKSFMTNPQNKQVLYYYRTSGSMTQEWFDDFVVGKKPHPQLCPFVWATGSLAALEIIKLVSGKWKPVAAPRYWEITAESAKIRKFGFGRRLMSRIIRNPSGQRIIPLLCKYPWLVRQFTKVIK